MDTVTHIYWVSVALQLGLQIHIVQPTSRPYFLGIRTQLCFLPKPWLVYIPFLFYNSCLWFSFSHFSSCLPLTPPNCSKSGVRNTAKHTLPRKKNCTGSKCSRTTMPLSPNTTKTPIITIIIQATLFPSTLSPISPTMNSKPLVSVFPLPCFDSNVPRINNPVTFCTFLLRSIGDRAAQLHPSKTKQAVVRLFFYLLPFS